MRLRQGHVLLIGSLFTNDNRAGTTIFNREHRGKSQPNDRKSLIKQCQAKTAAKRVEDWFEITLKISLSRVFRFLSPLKRRKSVQSQWNWKHNTVNTTGDQRSTESLRITRFTTCAPRYKVFQVYYCRLWFFSHTNCIWYVYEHLTGRYSPRGEI